MSGIKQLKNRIKSVSSTEKITSAMKMISVSKLRQNHELLLKAYPFADEIERMTRRLVRSVLARQEELTASGSNQKLPIPLLLKGHPSDNHHLVVCLTSDDGLCGQFNQMIIEKTAQVVQILKKQNKKITLLCFGKRGYEHLRRRISDVHIHFLPTKNDKKTPLFLDAERLSTSMADAFYKNDFDACSVVYMGFETAARQNVRVEQLIPLDTFQHEKKWEKLLPLDEPSYINRDVLGNKKIKKQHAILLSAIGAQNISSPLGAINAHGLLNTSTRLPSAYDYEPTDTEMLENILPFYLEAYIYKILLETRASEHTYRLLAMENASKNAGDMIKKFERTFHKKRQEGVTNNLIEVVSGATSEKTGDLT